MNMCEFGSGLADSCWKRQFSDLCSLLASGYSVDELDESGLTPLHICASLGWSEAVLLLLKYGADVHVTSPHGWTALMQAVSNGHTDTSRILINAGARLSDKNMSGWDVVALAVASSHETFLAVLTSVKVKHNLDQALAIACQQGKIQAVELLLGKGADVNRALPVSGMTPLMLAACEGNVDIVDKLLRFGANPHILNSSNLTAFDCASINGYNDLGSILSLHTKPKLKISPSFTFTSCPTIITSGGTISEVNGDTNTFALHPHPCTPLSQTLSSTSETSHSFNYLATGTTPYVQPYSIPGTPLHPYTPNSQTPGLPQSPQFFKFPPSPIYTCSPGCLPCSPCIPKPGYTYTQILPCLSPYFSPNPVVPPWMFAQGEKNIKANFKEKGSNNILSWWKRLKRRYKKKKLKKKVKVYVTFDEKLSSSNQLENLLRSLNLDFLMPVMNNHEMDVETFIHLTELDLDELGVTDKGLKQLILQKIANLKKNIVSNAFHQCI